MDWLELWQGPWRKRLSVNENRWIMLDVETSGLDVRHDHLLASAAIALKIDWSRKTLVLDLADSFEVMLRHDGGASKDNILLHGIGVQAQRQGLPGRHQHISLLYQPQPSPAVQYLIVAFY